MNRRALFKRLTVVAAVAALAPAVQPAEARAGELPVASDGALTMDTQAFDRLRDATYHAEMGEAWCIEHTDPATGAGHWHSLRDLLSDARAEGYRAGYEQRAMRDASRLALGLEV
jgi:hypothetical protein